MHSHQAERLLKGMLAEAGVDLGAPQFGAAWQAFRAFAETRFDDVDVEADGDLLLFEAGQTQIKPGIVPGQERAFVARLARQFSYVDEHGEYQGTQKVTLSLVDTTPPRSRESPRATIWGVARPASDVRRSATEGILPDALRWARAVERDAAFRLIQGSTALKGMLHQGPL